MDVPESDSDVNLSNEKESEVSSTCNDSLLISIPSINQTESASDCVTPLIQEETVNSDSPDTSGASVEQSGVEVSIRSEAEQSSSSENVGIIQHRDNISPEQEGNRDTIMGDISDVFSIAAGSETVVFEESFVISTTSDESTSYRMSEEKRDLEIPTSDNIESQIEMPQSEVSSIKVIGNSETSDGSLSDTKACSSNPDSTTIENAENTKNKNVSFIEEEVSTTGEDVGCQVSTSNSVTSIAKKLLSISSENEPVPTSKAESICGTSVESIVQDMQTSQSDVEISTVVECAPQNSGISTTSAKDDVSQRKRKWDQTVDKIGAENNPLKQARSDSKSSISGSQIHSPLPQPSTSKEQSNTINTESSKQSGFTHKQKRECDRPPLVTRTHEQVSSSKDIDFANKSSANQENKIDTTTKVTVIPQSSSALDLIKSNYSPFDDDLPSPGSSSQENQKCKQDISKTTGQCSSSTNKDSDTQESQTSKLTSLDHEEKVDLDSNVSKKLESDQKKETLLIIKGSTITKYSQPPASPMKQSEVTSKSSTETHKLQHTDQNLKTLSCSGTFLPEKDKKDIVLHEEKTHIIDTKVSLAEVTAKGTAFSSKAPITEQKFSVVAKISSSATDNACTSSPLKQQSDSEVLMQSKSLDSAKEFTKKDATVPITNIPPSQKQQSLSDALMQNKSPIFSKVSTVTINISSPLKQQSAVTEGSAQNKPSIVSQELTKKESSAITNIPSPLKQQSIVSGALQQDKLSLFSKESKNESSETTNIPSPLKQQSILSEALQPNKPSVFSKESSATTNIPSPLKQQSILSEALQQDKPSVFSKEPSATTDIPSPLKQQSILSEALQQNKPSVFAKESSATTNIPSPLKQQSIVSEASQQNKPSVFSKDSTKKESIATTNIPPPLQKSTVSEALQQNKPSLFSKESTKKESSAITNIPSPLKQQFIVSEALQQDKPPVFSKESSAVIDISSPLKQQSILSEALQQNKPSVFSKESSAITDIPSPLKQQSILSEASQRSKPSVFSKESSATTNIPSPLKQQSIVSEASQQNKPSVFSKDSTKKESSATTNIPPPLQKCIVSEALQQNKPSLFSKESTKKESSATTNIPPPLKEQSILSEALQQDKPSVFSKDSSATTNTQSTLKQQSILSEALQQDKPSVFSKESSATTNIPSPLKQETVVSEALQQNKPSVCSKESSTTTNIPTPLQKSIVSEVLLQNKPSVFSKGSTKKESIATANISSPLKQQYVVTESSIQNKPPVFTKDSTKKESSSTNIPLPLKQQPIVTETPMQNNPAALSEESVKKESTVLTTNISLPLKQQLVTEAAVPSFLSKESMKRESTITTYIPAKEELNKEKYSSTKNTQVEGTSVISKSPIVGPSSMKEVHSAIIKPEDKENSTIQDTQMKEITSAAANALMPESSSIKEVQCTTTKPVDKGKSSISKETQIKETTSITIETPILESSSINVHSIATKPENISSSKNIQINKGIAVTKTPMLESPSKVLSTIIKVVDKDNPSAIKTTQIKEATTKVPISASPTKEVHSIITKSMSKENVSASEATQIKEGTSITTEMAILETPSTKEVHSTVTKLMDKEKSSTAKDTQMKEVTSVISKPSVLDSPSTKEVHSAVFKPAEKETFSASKNMETKGVSTKTPAQASLTPKEVHFIVTKPVDKENSSTQMVEGTSVTTKTSMLESASVTKTKEFSCTTDVFKKDLSIMSEVLTKEKFSARTTELSGKDPVISTETFKKEQAVDKEECNAPTTNLKSSSVAESSIKRELSIVSEEPLRKSSSFLTSTLSPKESSVKAPQNKDESPVLILPLVKKDSPVSKETLQPIQKELPSQEVFPDFTETLASRSSLIKTDAQVETKVSVVKPETTAEKTQEDKSEVSLAQKQPSIAQEIFERRESLATEMLKEKDILDSPSAKAETSINSTKSKSPIQESDNVEAQVTEFKSFVDKVPPREKIDNVKVSADDRDVKTLTVNKDEIQRKQTSVTTVQPVKKNMTPYDTKVKEGSVTKDEMQGKQTSITTEQPVKKSTTPCVTQVKELNITKGKQEKQTVVTTEQPMEKNATPCVTQVKEINETKDEMQGKQTSVTAVQPSEKNSTPCVTQVKEINVTIDEMQGKDTSVTTVQPLEKNTTPCVTEVKEINMTTDKMQGKETSVTTVQPVKKSTTPCVTQVKELNVTKDEMQGKLTSVTTEQPSEKNTTPCVTQVKELNVIKDGKQENQTSVTTVQPMEKNTTPCVTQVKEINVTTDEMQGKQTSVTTVQPVKKNTTPCVTQVKEINVTKDEMQGKLTSVTTEQPVKRSTTPCVTQVKELNVIKDGKQENQTSVTTVQPMEKNTTPCVTQIKEINVTKDEMQGSHTSVTTVQPVKKNTTACITQVKEINVTKDEMQEKLTSVTTEQPVKKSTTPCVTKVKELNVTKEKQEKQTVVTTEQSLKSSTIPCVTQVKELNAIKEGKQENQTSVTTVQPMEKNTAPCVTKVKERNVTKDEMQEKQTSVTTEQPMKKGTTSCVTQVKEINVTKDEMQEKPTSVTTEQPMKKGTTSCVTQVKELNVTKEKQEKQTVVTTEQPLEKNITPCVTQVKEINVTKDEMQGKQTSVTTEQPLKKSATPCVTQVKEINVTKDEKLTSVTTEQPMKKGTTSCVTQVKELNVTKEKQEKQTVVTTEQPLEKNITPCVTQVKEINVTKYEMQGTHTPVTTVQPVKKNITSGTTQVKKLNVTEDEMQGKQTSVTTVQPLEKNTAPCVTQVKEINVTIDEMQGKQTSVTTEQPVKKNKSPYVTQVKEINVSKDEIQKKQISVTSVQPEKKSIIPCVTQAKEINVDNAQSSSQTSISARIPSETIETPTGDRPVQAKVEMAKDTVVSEKLGETAVVQTQSTQSESSSSCKQLVEREKTLETKVQKEKKIEELSNDKDILIDSSNQSVKKEDVSLIKMPEKDANSSSQLEVRKEEKLSKSADIKNDMSLVSEKKTTEKNLEITNESIGKPSVSNAIGAMSPTNKDKEVIRKRLAEVIAKQKSPSDSQILIVPTSTKSETVMKKELPVPDENLAAAMKESIKKAISKISEKSDFGQLSVAENTFSSETKGKQDVASEKSIIPSFEHKVPVDSPATVEILCTTNLKSTETSSKSISRDDTKLGEPESRQTKNETEKHVNVIVTDDKKKSNNVPEKEFQKSNENMSDVQKSSSAQRVKLVRPVFSSSKDLAKSEKLPPTSSEVIKSVSSSSETATASYTSSRSCGQVPDKLIAGTVKPEILVPEKKVKEEKLLSQTPSASLPIETKEPSVPSKNVLQKPEMPELSSFSKQPALSLPVGHKQKSSNKPEAIEQTELRNEDPEKTVTKLPLCTEVSRSDLSSMPKDVKRVDLPIKKEDSVTSRKEEILVKDVKKLSDSKAPIVVPSKETRTSELTSNTCKKSLLRNKSEEILQEDSREKSGGMETITKSSDLQGSEISVTKPSKHSARSPIKDGPPVELAVGSLVNKEKMSTCDKNQSVSKSVDIAFHKSSVHQPASEKKSSVPGDKGKIATEILDVKTKNVDMKAEVTVTGSTDRAEISEVAIAHSTSTDISTQQKTASVHEENIQVVSSSSKKSSEHKIEEITVKENVDISKDKITSKKNFPLQSETTVSSTDDLKSESFESNSSGKKEDIPHSQKGTKREKTDPSYLCSDNKQTVISEAQPSTGTEPANRSTLTAPGTSKKSEVVKSDLKQERTTSTCRTQISLSSKKDGITVDSKSVTKEVKQAQTKSHLEGGKKDAESVKPSETSKPAHAKTMEVKDANSTVDSKSEKIVKPDKIILKITKDMTSSTESSTSLVRDIQAESKIQKSETVSKLATLNSSTIAKQETVSESKVLSPDSSLAPKEHAKVEKLTLKLNKDPSSDDGTITKQSWTSSVSSDVEQNETVTSPKHENINIKLKKDSSSLSFKATPSPCIAETLQKEENLEGSKVEKLTLKLKKDTPKSEDNVQESCSLTKEEGSKPVKEEPKLEKITLKIKKDPAHPDIIVATTSSVTSQPGDVITTKLSGVEQAESVPSSTSQDGGKSPKITLKLKKDCTKQELSKEVLHSETSVTPIQISESQGPGLKEESSSDKITLKSKKEISKSEVNAPAIPKENISRETTITPIKLKDGKIQEIPTSHIKDKPVIEKLTLKLKKDSTTVSSTAKEDTRPETTITRVKASEVKPSDGSLSVTPKTEPVVEKITLKLKKDATKCETAVLPETTVMQVRVAEAHKSDVNVAQSSKEEAVVEKITLKLKKDGGKPETAVTASKGTTSQNSSSVLTKSTDVKLKHTDVNVASVLTKPIDVKQKHTDVNITATKESTVVEKITLKIKKDPVKQEVHPSATKQPPVKSTRASAAVHQDEPKLEKLTLKLKKDTGKSVTVSGKENEASKQPDLVASKSDVILKEEKVEKLTLKFKKDTSTSEIIAGKKIPEQDSNVIDTQIPEQSDVMSKEEGKVEKLTLKLKKTELPEGESEITSTQVEEENYVDPLTQPAKEGKVEKLTLKLRKDSSKSEEAILPSPKEVIDIDVPSSHATVDQEIKPSDEAAPDVGKQKKITLTFKKDAAWSVKRKRIKTSDSSDSSKEVTVDETNRLSTEDENLPDIPHKRAKLEEEITTEKAESQTSTCMGIVTESTESAPDIVKSIIKEEVKERSGLDDKHSQRPQKGFKRRETSETRQSEESSSKKVKHDHNKKNDVASDSSKSQTREKASVHRQDTNIPHEVRSECKDTKPSQGEQVPKPTVEGKLREILSRIGPKASTIVSGDLSISISTVKTEPNQQSHEISGSHITESKDMKDTYGISNKDSIEKSGSTDKFPTPMEIKEESDSQDVVIIEEESTIKPMPQLKLEKCPVVVPVSEKAVTKEPPEEKAPEIQVIKVEPKKGRGRPRKTPLVPSAIPVVEPPPEQVSRPKRMCRGRERPPVVVKQRKPRTGKPPGRKKKVVEDVKPASELPRPAEVSTSATEISPSLSVTSTSVTDDSSLVLNATANKESPAISVEHTTSSIPAEEIDRPTGIFSEPLAVSDKTPFTPEQPSSTTPAKETPSIISTETSSTEISSLAAPDVPPASEIIAESPSPCPTPSVSTVQVFEEETRMSAESGSRSQTPARTLPTTGVTDGPGEESQGSAISTATTESVKKKGRLEVGDGETKEFTVDQVIEYQWPVDKGGENLMIQEQISEYLGVKSFKRKYPDIKRRPVEAEEKTYLREKGLVTESMCDMGLTAVNSTEILDIMYADFQEKYEEYRRFIRERQAKEFSTKQKAISSAASVEKNKLDYKDKAVRSAATWNSTFNRARRDERRCCFDLQSFTIHYPRNKIVKSLPKDPIKLGHYPLSLIPGQYTDFYKSYTPTELRYFPLNTVLYGPMKPNERHDPGAISDGSQSDSDDTSSSDDSSSTSSEETQDTEETGSTNGDVDPENSQDQANQESGEKEGDKDQTSSVKVKDEKKDKDREGAICKVCSGDHSKNKDGQAEVLIHCAQCTSSGHPSCLDLTLDMVPHIKRYDWQCTDCKTCIQCKDPADEDKMLFCDMCDRGYHIYCVGLRRVPSGRWHCKECAVCGSCGTQEPGGINPDTPNAQWQHEYKKGEKGARVYAQTLCVPCSKLWRKGRYCQLCWRCYGNKPDEEDGLINCSVCDKWMHAECCNAIGGNEIDKTSNFLCEICQEKGQARSPAIKMIPRSILKV
ncbi:serine-rich adhesin for platelets-like isoform X2 [Periplaneta americana]|uniref:serine-rich adhesin for platelets-like isoform X2 n=1 Tax=Periplaneta americana TaxID=6978 RepID=UPI0037E868D1